MDGKRAFRRLSSWAGQKLLALLYRKKPMDIPEAHSPSLRFLLEKCIVEDAVAAVKKAPDKMNQLLAAVDDKQTCLSALFTLGLLSKQGFDISEAITSLLICSAGDDRNESSLAAKALAFHSLNFRRTEQIDTLILSGHDGAVVGVKEALREAVIAINQTAIDYVFEKLALQDTCADMSWVLKSAAAVWDEELHKALRTAMSGFKKRHTLISLTVLQTFKDMEERMRAASD